MIGPIGRKEGTDASSGDLEALLGIYEAKGTEIGRTVIRDAC